jgi:hypothetical protein
MVAKATVGRKMKGSGVISTGQAYSLEGANMTPSDSIIPPYKVAAKKHLGEFYHDGN